MPTYTYETIPADQTAKSRTFEVVQKMTDKPLQADPQTGEPVRRVISGGLGIKLKVLRRSTVVDKSSPAATACGCATGRPHKHHHHHGHGHHHHHGHGHHHHHGHGHHHHHGHGDEHGGHD